MPAIRDREDGHQRRKDRLALMKRGPGVFVYNGNAFDVESIPTPLLIGRNTLALDKEGLPIRDASGRQMLQPAGKYKLDDEGHVILGGVPKIVKHPIEVFKLRGREFPKGKKVKVDDPSLALKLRGMDCFDEVDGDADDEDDDEESSELSRSELMSLASARGLKPERTATKADLAAMLAAAENEVEG